MAILKDLIVHGSSRFLNKIYASEIQTPLIEAEAGIFKKLKADDATVVGLLDVKGQLHTNSWTNSNIATIDGSFYITPTIGSGQGTVAITSSTLKFTRKDENNSFAIESLYLGDNNSITWPQYSKVLVTGQIQLNGEWTPLGTLLGQISGTATAASITINNIKDNKKPPSNTSNVYTALVNSGISSTDYRNLKISLYQRAASQTDFRPLGIYMTAIGDNGRTFLDIYGGVNSLNTTSSNYGGLAEPNVRIGNLQGLPNVGGQTPSGWGIYTDNGYFKGIIAADKGYIGSGSKYWVIANEEDVSNVENSRSYIYNGKVSYNDTTNDGVYLGTDGIGLGKGNFYVTKTGSLTAKSGNISGWQIDANSFHFGTWGTDNSAIICTGTGGSKSIGGSESINNWVFAAGANFGVTKSGALYANSANISGKIIATSGSIGGVNIVDGNLDVSSINIGSLKGAKDFSSDNLLKDVYASSLTKENAPWDRYLSEASNTTITGQFIAETNLPDPNATHFYRITDSSASTKGRGLCFYSSGTPPFIDGHTYRIGCWVRKHAGSPKVFITLGSIGSLTHTQQIVDNTEWEWIEVVRTFGDTDPDITTRTDTYKRLYFYFYNNNVAGSSLDMCGFRMEEVQVNSGTARNFLLGTEKLTNWGTVNGATISNGVATFSTITANSWREIYPAKNFKYDLIRNQNVISSIKVRAENGKKCCLNFCVGVESTETAYTRQKYFNQFIYFTGTGEWQTVCSAIPIFDYMFASGTGTVDFNDCWVTVRIGAVNNYWNGFQAKEPQLCLGTTATSWSRAPEDVDETINNIEIGGRNLIRNTAIMPTTKINGYNFRASGGTVSHVDISSSPINGITGAIRITNKGSSVAQVGMAQDSLKNCFIVGEAYTMSCWVRASTNMDIVFQMIWASNEQTTRSSGTILGYKFKAGTDWTYLKWEGATLLGTQVSQYSAGYVYGTSVPANGWFEVCGLKVEKGNKATAWTPAPEDIEASAVTEEQYIYIQATSGTNSVNPTATWVTEDGESTISDTQGLMPVWTTKRPTYRTNYPVIFIAKQKKTVDGTVTCTTPIKDDTLTIIDGGHITTGTIDASKVTVTNIDASKITTGTLKAERINTKSISIGDFKDGDDYAKTEDVNTAIDNIEVGGRNLLKESNCLAPIQTSKGITLTYNGNGWFNVNGTVTGTSAGILCFYGSSQYTSNISGSGEYTLSIETNGTIFLPSNKTFIQLAYHSDNATNNTIAGDFKILSGSTKVTFTIPENNHISRVCLFIQANATGGVVDGNIRLKLERGNKATDWTPAPEDVVNEAVNKVEVGGRNLIRNSTNFNKWVVQNGGAEGEIWHRSLSGKTSNANARPRTWIGTGYLADYYNKTLTISFEIMSPNWSAIEEGSSNTGLNGLAIQLETASGIPYSSSIGDTGRYFFKRLGDKKYFKTDSDLVDGKWVKITSIPLKIDDTLWNNSTTLIDGYDYFTFSFILRRNGTVSFRKPQIEIGNKATDWNLAPEDVNADIEDARKVATNYLAVDNTGIMVADMQYGEQTPSTATGRNVFIDNDSVDIRNGTTTLASFTGDNTKFYDPIYDKELATFGTSGAIIGANNEQRFVIEKDGIKSINDSGATVFSVNSTEGTVVTEAEVAPSGEANAWYSTSIKLDPVGSGFSVDVTFYNKSMTARFEISHCNSNLTNVKVNSVSSSATLISFGPNAGTYSIDLPPFTFTHGTAQTITYTITASFVNIFGDSYNLTVVETVTYDGAITIIISSLDGECVRTSGNNEEESKFMGSWSKVIYGKIYQSSAYTKAPAMAFGTRGKNAILAPFSVTIGKDLYANNDNQLSIGRYNLNNDEFAFAIGNGTSDTNRSNAFNVDWDGNTEVMGNLEVNNNQTVTNNLSVGGDETIIGGLTVNGIITDFSNSYSTIKNLNVEYLTVSTRKPFSLVQKTYTRTITANSGCYISQKYTSPTGYTPIGIIDWGTFNGTHADYCIMGHAYIWRGNPNTIDIYVWNQHPSQSATNVVIYVNILCIANTFL